MHDHAPRESKALPSFDDLYREVILDHYRRPRGRKPIQCPDVENEGLNPVCGDEVKIALKFDGDVVKEVAVHGRGCAISTAAGSMLAEILPGKTREEVQTLTDLVKKMMHEAVDLDDMDVGDLDALSGIRQFPVRVKCAMLAWATLADAIKSWEARQGKAGDDPAAEEPGATGASEKAVTEPATKG